MLYEPAEDSFLLRDHLKPYAKGRVLDMGTGSGILAQEAAQYADNVIAADINPEARGVATQNITFIETNLFQNIKGTFDLIIFNPPYLPNVKSHCDPALDGGKQGYEVIARFLQDAGKFLKHRGHILLLFSSYSKPRKVKLLMQEHYTFQLIATQKLFFEELYVYVLQKRVDPRC
ncbi:methyltransferase [Candidatus Woesearchaeota archaeon]|nr:methyltransferase [Candidatus Woesearchaeota archaeon]